jgi:hypothetical protein
VQFLDAGLVGAIHAIHASFYRDVLAGRASHKAGYHEQEAGDESYHHDGENAQPDSVPPL